MDAIKPYVYIGEHRETGQCYIGFRCANTVPAEQDLGTCYFTSSETVKPIFHEFDWHIVGEYDSKEDAIDQETQLIREFIKNGLLLNKHASGRFYNSKPHSEETKRKMSEAQKGKPRQEITAETRAKISATHKGRKRSPEHQAKLNNSHRGRKLSEETKAKISEKVKGKPRPPELVRQIALSNTGKKRSEETKAKIAQTNKETWAKKLNKESEQNVE